MSFVRMLGMNVSDDLFTTYLKGRRPLADVLQSR
jgi:hypothetical protein